jgi:hypothetical protein
MFKICCTCRRELKVENFSKNKSCKDGLKQYCKECASKKNKKYRNANKDKVLKANKKWYEKSKQDKDVRTKSELALQVKVCNCCNIEKNVQDFYKRGNGGFYSECKQCCLKKQKKYASENREHIINRKRFYNKLNADNIKKYNKKYYSINSDDVKLRLKKWIKNNPEKYKLQRIKAMHVRKSKIKNLKNDFTKKQWEYCKLYFKNTCAYCKRKTNKITQEHFIPVNKGGHYTFNNILPVCNKCNSSKQDKDFEEWFIQQNFYNEETKRNIYKYFKHINLDMPIPCQAQ